ncbi:unnamed protein product, partial [Aphanomyces euteiches]
NTTQRAPELDDWIDDDPTPVGILQENPNTIRLMPVETIPVFDGNRDDRDAAATWLSRFEETAFSCGWSDVETLRRFKLHTAKPVQDWVSQLDPSFKASWPNLRARFRREYVRSRVSKEAVYYNMRQRPGEHVKDYFVRLNAAAINIRLDYRRSRSILDDHIDRFANSLLDTALGTVIRQQQFVSIDNLESYLERQLANGTTAKVQTDTSIPKQTTNTIPISDRVKAKKNNVQFMDEDLGSSRISRYLDCAGLQDGPNKQQTPEKEGKHKIRQKEENKKTTQKSGRLHSNPRRNTPLEKKVPVMEYIARFQLCRTINPLCCQGSHNPALGL